jgi:hypothetical protein
MELDAVQQLISNIGFPMFVAIWMLFKNSKDQEKVSDALNKLESAISKMNEGQTK